MSVQLIKSGRTWALVSLLAFQLVLLGLVWGSFQGYFIISTQTPFGDRYKVLVYLLLAASAFTIVVVPTFAWILPATLKQLPLVRSITFELGWLAVLTVLWTGVVPKLIVDWRSLHRFYCVRPYGQSNLPGDLGRDSICGQLDSIFTFGILSWVWLLVLTAGLLAYGISRSSKNPSVWQTPFGALLDEEGHLPKDRSVDLDGADRRPYHR